MIANQGVRLVRGEAWASSDSDGGEGGLGTIVHLQNNADKTIATVVWDNGMKCFYGIGQESSREILAHDSKQNGAKFCLYCTFPRFSFLYFLPFILNFFGSKRKYFH